VWPALCRRCWQLIWITVWSHHPHYGESRIRCRQSLSGKDVDKKAVIAELIRRFSLWIGGATTLSDKTGHKDWLNATRRKDWRYWQRYRDFLESKMSVKAVDALDVATNKILELLEDPLRGVWDRRGLVVGHVQSGKTGNYTGLICAADAGYKIIIVLAGTNFVRIQIRLEEGFLGYETSAKNDVVRYTALRMPGRNSSQLCNESPDNGDFNTRVAKHLAISPEQRPWLFVVKKNKTVLERLLKWIVIMLQTPKMLMGVLWFRVSHYF
jgi:hypothetical protein